VWRVIADSRAEDDASEDAVRVAAAVANGSWCHLTDDGGEGNKLPTTRFLFIRDCRQERPDGAGI
jgi:hypothetical protein